MRKTICVDLDGVLADYSKGWQGISTIGDPIPGAVDFVQKLNKLGRVVIFTCRCNLLLNQNETADNLRYIVAAWLDKHGFEYDEIYQGVGKPVASAYIDDRAVHCDPGFALGQALGLADLPAGNTTSLCDIEILAAVWDKALAETARLMEREDGFVSDSGITV